MNEAKSLIDPGDFGSFGRYEEVPLKKMESEMKETYERTLHLRGLVPGPPKIWLANPGLSTTIIPIGAYFQKDSSLTKAEIEIVTVLTNARWNTTYSAYEHEKISEKLGHIPAEAVERLITGLDVTFDDLRQQVIYELASALLQPRFVLIGLFKRAK